MKRRTSRIKGFTVLEIIVVIVIITIIATIGHQAYITYLIRAKIAGAIHVLDEYQDNAMSLYDRNGKIDPYYVLFSPENTAGWVSGAPGDTSAVKNLALKYVNTVTATTGTSGGNNYILLGAGMVDDGYLITNADHLYVAGIIQPNGAITWSCGISASHSDNINTKFLPETCQSTLP